jgi:alpha-tubulin suppressor-like RCC1 family protein
MLQSQTPICLTEISVSLPGLPTISFQDQHIKWVKRKTSCWTMGNNKFDLNMKKFYYFDDLAVSVLLCDLKED